MSRYLAILAILAIAPAPAAGAPTPEFPQPIFAHESVAATDGAWGFTLNPAGGGLHYPTELLLALTELEPTGRLYRGAYSNGGAGFAASVPTDGPRAFTLGFTGGQDLMRIGASVTRLREQGGGGRATDYKMGLLSRPVPWLSLGAVADHLFQTEFLGTRLGRQRRQLEPRARGHVEDQLGVAAGVGHHRDAPS